MTLPSPDQPVVVVTGGGGGIGAAIAIELGRRGTHVVTVDPLVSVDGSEQVRSTEQTTAQRIVADGGSARASNISVTDRDAVRELFAGLAAERGRLDGVVNVAGITRPTGFAKGSEEDWGAVLAVHLDGYRNVLDAALPLMAEAGRGRILGVTSGSGWRAADAGAYSCAKRAVASLTWQLGHVAPPGVGINAISPIAMTRMVTAALQRSSAAGSTGAGRSGSATPGTATGGLTLAGMPAPEDLGPLGADLVGTSLSAVRAQVLFAGGSEVALVEPPRLLEVVRTSGVASVAAVLDAVTPSWTAVESAQATSGGSNPRFGSIFDEPPGPLRPTTDVRAVVVITDRAELGSAIRHQMDALQVRCEVVSAGGIPAGFTGARQALDAASERLGGADAAIVATGSRPDGTSGDNWTSVLADHDGTTARILQDAAWARAAAEHVATSGRPLRLVMVVDAADAGGRSRAQAAAQLARVSRRATDGDVEAVAVAIEHRDTLGPTAELVCHLATHDDATGLTGAELAVGAGWIGLRSHPRPGGSIVFGGPEIPAWFGPTLAELIGGAAP